MAQHHSQRFLISYDSGKSWKIDVIPNTTLYNIRVGDKYWTVGTEVIHKDSRAVVTQCQYSADGEKWDQSSNNLSSCRPQVRAHHRLLAMTTAVTGILMDADVSSSQGRGLFVLNSGSCH